MKLIVTRRNRGFTLLEVLVAIALFALLSVLTYASLSQMLDGRVRIDAERERWRTLALVFVQLEDDLAHARPNRKVRSADGTQSLDGFIIRPIDTRPLGEPFLELTRGGLFVSGDSSTSDLQRVGYKLTEGALLKLVWPVLDQAPTTKPREIVLLSNVDNLTIEPYPNLPLAQTSAASTQNTSPDAVKIAFDLAGVGRLSRTLLVNR